MIAIIIQARMGSTRLPGKILTDLCGKPVLWHVITRARRSKLIDTLLVATTNDADDDITERYCESIGIGVFRGPSNDVLARYYLASRYLIDGGRDLTHLVRITADCPLIDPGIIDRVIQRALALDADYASNTNPPTYPDGLDVEVMKYTALEIAYKEANLDSDREHVTPFIRNNKRFTQINILHHPNLSKLRWTLDTPEDLLFLKEVLSRVGPDNNFNMNDVLRILEREPELMKINSMYIRNEGYTKSLMDDSKPKG